MPVLIPARFVLPLVLCALVIGPVTEARAQKTPSLPKALQSKLKGTLQTALSAVITRRKRGLGRASIGVAVIDANTGEQLFTYRGKRGFGAASNAKIITTAAALELLGSNFRFHTELLAEAVDDRGHVKGNLYIRGKGNALFGHSDMIALVHTLKAAGIKRIHGSIVVDNSYFDDNNLPPRFDDQPDEDAAFRAPIAATSYTFNAYTLFVRPSLSGRGPARIEVTPPNQYVKVLGGANTVRSGRTRLKVQSEVQPNGITVQISGKIRNIVERRRFRRRVEDPVAFVGTGLLVTLANAGITVKRRTIKSGVTPKEAMLLALHESPPLAVLIRGMGKYSNNFVAELLLKVIGAETVAKGQPATWQHGLTAIHTFLHRVGLPKGQYRFENGSGLFDSNRFTPLQIARVLRFAYQEFRWGPDLLASLSIAGQDGTLIRRMNDGPADGLVRAKTGTLDHTSALSGVAAVHGNAPIIFSILINGFPKSSVGIARALQDDIAEEIIRALQ